MRVPLKCPGSEFIVRKIRLSSSWSTFMNTTLDTTNKIMVTLEGSIAVNIK